MTGGDSHGTRTDRGEATAAKRSNPFPPSGIRVCKSQHPTKPYYLQSLLNDWEEHRYFGAHAILGEEFATLEEAEARAEALR